MNCPFYCKLKALSLWSTVAFCLVICRFKFFFLPIDHLFYIIEKEIHWDLVKNLVSLHKKNSAPIVPRKNENYNNVETNYESSMNHECLQ